MATTCYFEEEIVDQGGEHRLFVEFGRSSYYNGHPVPGGTGTDSIYITVGDQTVIMDSDTARKFVEAASAVGRYHGFLD